MLTIKFNAQPQQPTQKKSLRQRFNDWLNGKNYVKPTQEEVRESERLAQEATENEIEDSQADGLFIDDADIMLPEEIDE